MRSGKLTGIALIILGMMLYASTPVLGAAAVVSSNVQALEDGNYLIKLTVTASKVGIYAFELKDPKGSVLDVYAPKGWCILSDGEVCLARTGNLPINAGKSVEFIIHSSTKDTKFVWTFFGEMEQLGKSEVL
jgi:membrane-bound ClpP family serine protease